MCSVLSVYDHVYALLSLHFMISAMIGLSWLYCKICTVNMYYRRYVCTVNVFFTVLYST